MAGGSAKQSNENASYINFRPGDQQAMNNQLGVFQNANDNYVNQVNAANQKFVIPGQQGLDAISKTQIGLAQQDVNNRLHAQQNAIMQQFRRQPGAASVLQQQAGNNAILANNGMGFQAALAQQQREAGQNNALMQQLQMQSQVPQAQQNLLSVLAQMAGMQGQQIGKGSAEQSKKGMFGF